MAARGESRRKKPAESQTKLETSASSTPSGQLEKKKPRRSSSEAGGKRQAAGEQTEVLVDPARLKLMEQIIVSAGQLCEVLGRGFGHGTPVPSHPSPPATGDQSTRRLRDYLASVADLQMDECRRVAEIAEQTLEQIYVHLPLKRAMHAVDPVQRLRVLRRRLAGKSTRAFHAEMVAIFHSLRDLHTSYVLPAPYQGVTAFLPFLVEKCYDRKDKAGNSPRYIVTKLRDDVLHPDFVVGVRVTHWNGIPIDRAVEIVAEREAGSNDDAKEARGLEALTIRPLALTAPPDEEWVVIGYESGGRAREVRFNWMVFSPPPSPSGIRLASEQRRLAHIGIDARTEDVRRAKKLLFSPGKMDAERRMADPAARAQVRELSAQQRQRGLSPFPHAAPGPPAPSVLGVDTQTESVRLAKKDLYAQEGEAAGLGLEKSEDAEIVAFSSAAVDESIMPDVFEFQRVPGPRGKVGYVRIYTFMVMDTDAFIEEFTRIVHLLPPTGLIIDVRGNGGGNILAGERLLQLLTARPIEPARFQFINTEATFELCSSSPLGLDLKRWASSIGLAVESGEVYSQGFPLQSPEDVNLVGQQYQGPVVLITDALCYSATDIFAAGFQDHRIGKILGASRRTGAGGANVWEYDLLQQALPRRFPNLPRQTSLRVAVRRCTRVGDRSGVPVEDFGVEPDEVHLMTEDDVLRGNIDLIQHAAALLAQETPHLLSARADWSRPGGAVVEVLGQNITRVDLYQDGRPIGSQDLSTGAAIISLPSDLNSARPLMLRGFEGERIVAAATIRPTAG